MSKTTLTTQAEVTEFIAKLLGNERMRLSYGRNINFWRIEPSVITEENKTYFNEVTAERSYSLKLMDDGSTIMYETRMHREIKQMSNNEYEDICHVDEMYAFSGVGEAAI